MILHAKNIGFAYQNGNAVFRDLNLSLKAGEIISIVGPSGAGKSTFLKALAGHLQINAGQILYQGNPLLGPEEKLTAGHPDIAIVNQLFELDYYFTVEENISNRLHHLDDSQHTQFTNELITVFDLQEIAKTPSKNISGGEQQRLAMACALAKEPQVLLLDEPFVHFDVHLNKRIGDYLRQLSNLRKMSVILVTHDGQDALAWSDQIIMMRKGRLNSHYSPEKAYFSPKSLYEGRFFGELNSVYIEEKHLLFRPNEYSLKLIKDKARLKVNWKYAHFKGPFFANYFALTNGKEIVLYANKELSVTKEIYV